MKLFGKDNANKEVKPEVKPNYTALLDQLLADLTALLEDVVAANVYKESAEQVKVLVDIVLLQKKVVECMCGNTNILSSSVRHALQNMRADIEEKLRELDPEHMVPQVSDALTLKAAVHYKTFLEAFLSNENVMKGTLPDGWKMIVEANLKLERKDHQKRLAELKKRIHIHSAPEMSLTAATAESVATNITKIPTTATTTAATAATAATTTATTTATTAATTAAVATTTATVATTAATTTAATKTKTKTTPVVSIASFSALPSTTTSTTASTTSASTDETTTASRRRRK